MNNVIRFTVGFPTDRGFLGRRCAAAECGRYFKVARDLGEARIHCPYCGAQAGPAELLTPDQASYAKDVATEHAREFVEGELSKMIDKLVKRSGGTIRRGGGRPPHRARSVQPRYTERQVDSELTCPDCAAKFQVYGIFGHCPACRRQNLKIYDADIEIIRREIARSVVSERVLRHAYGDLVSTFEIFCRSKAPVAPKSRGTFQRLDDSKAFFLQHLAVDIFVGLEPAESLDLRRCFQKRHSYQHAGGIIDEHYVRGVPEDAALLGQKAVLSMDEFEGGADAVRKVLTTLSQACDPA